MLLDQQVVVIIFAKYNLRTQTTPRRRLNRCSQYNEEFKTYQPHKQSQNILKALNQLNTSNLVMK
jgi:hypothetical protein